MNNETFLESGKIVTMGQDLKCFVSNDTKMSTLQELQSDKENFQRVLNDTLDLGVDIVKGILPDQCIGYRSGFWAYQYCSKRQFSQYHGTPTHPTLIYVLGRPDKRDSNRHFELLYNDFGYYINEVIGSGDICDLSGEPRTIEVQYVCGSAVGEASIQWVREVATCKYQAQISVPDLCNVDLLSINEDKHAAMSIFCSRSNELEHGVVDLTTLYDPIFLGRSIYLLRPNALGNNKKYKLMYSGPLPSGESWELPSEHLYKTFNTIFGRMMDLHLLKDSDGSIAEIGDAFEWIADIVDTDGKFLSRFKVKESPNDTLELLLFKSLHSGVDGNFISFQKLGRKLKKNKNAQALNSNGKDISFDFSEEKLKKLLSNAGDLNLVMVDPVSGVQRVVHDIDTIYEQLLHSGQILEVLGDDIDIENILQMMQLDDGEPTFVKAVEPTQDENIPNENEKSNILIDKEESGENGQNDEVEATLEKKELNVEDDFLDNKNNLDNHDQIAQGDMENNGETSQENTDNQREPSQESTENQEETSQEGTKNQVNAESLNENESDVTQTEKDIETKKEEQKESSIEVNIEKEERLDEIPFGQAKEVKENESSLPGDQNEPSAGENNDQYDERDTKTEMDGSVDQPIEDAYNNIQAEHDAVKHTMMDSQVS